MGSVLKAGQCATEEVLCYNQKDHAYLLGLVSEGNSCLQALAKERELCQKTISKPWYQNGWLWFTIGIVFGGATVGFAVSR